MLLIFIFEYFLKVGFLWVRWVGGKTPLGGVCQVLMATYSTKFHLVNSTVHQKEETTIPLHLAPSGAKKEQAFAGVILKRERHSGPLYAHSGPHFSTLEHKNEVLSLQNGKGACK